MPVIRRKDNQAAGDHLLGLLRTEGSLRYSRFYDGSDKTHEALLRGMGLGEDHCDSPEWAMDTAVAQLEKAGLVATRTTADLLADGNRDYEISLTDEGRAFLAEGKSFPYRDVDLCGADAVPALPWRPTKDDPDDKYPTDDEFSAGQITSSFKWVGWEIEGQQFGVVDLKLGSTILVWGKRPPGLTDPEDALLRQELAIVRGGLSEAGAEELCHLLFGGGYLLLAKPVGIPLYDLTPVGPEKMWEEFHRFDEVLDRLRDLAQRASRCADAGEG
jgi:hypothetical protein